MPNELDIQKRIVDAVNDDLGGFAFKMSNRFLIGIVDLFIQLPNQPQAIIEVKYWRDLPSRDDTAIDIGLTALQKKCIKDNQRATGRAGWLAAHLTRNEDFYFASPDVNLKMTRKDMLECALRRPRGTPLSKILPLVLAPVLR